MKREALERSESRWGGGVNQMDQMDPSTIAIEVATVDEGSGEEQEGRRSELSLDRLGWTR